MMEVMDVFALTIAARLASFMTPIPTELLTNLAETIHDLQPHQVGPAAGAASS